MLLVGDTACDIALNASLSWSVVNDQCSVCIHPSHSTGVYLNVLLSFCSAAEKYLGFGSARPFSDELFYMIMRLGHLLNALEYEVLKGVF